jgi:hypothetical protein
MSRKANIDAKIVLHSRVGREGYQTLEAYAERRGCSLTQALRDLLADLKQRELEDTSGTRLESLARTLSGVVEQQARHATRIEALVAILRKVEEGQAEREAQILQTLAVVVNLSQHTFAYLMGVVESSPRSADIIVSGKAKLQALRGEG